MLPVHVHRNRGIFNLSIIQYIPHGGSSLTDYIKYCAYLYYILSLEYFSLQQLWTFGRVLTDSFT
jgi:hypothetical protein